MDKSTFFNIFSNQFLRVFIFDQVLHIFKDVLKVKKTLKWEELIESPKALMENGYFLQFKDYFKRYEITKINRSETPLTKIVCSRNVDALKFIIEELDFDYLSNFFRYNDRDISVHNGDLYLVASQVSGNLEMLKYLDSLLDNRRLPHSTNSGDHSNSTNITIDDIDFYEWNHLDSLYAISKLGDFEMFKFSVNKVIPLYSGTRSYKLLKYFNNATDNLLDLGRVDIIEWLVEKSPVPISFRESSVVSCIRSGNLSVLQYCYSNCKDHSIFKDLNLNRVGNRKAWSLEIIKWLHDNDIVRFTTSLMKGVSIDIVKWLHENRTEGCTNDTMDFAASIGDFEVVKWLHENRTEGCTSSAMDNAASHGHFGIVKWLHENRTEGCTADAVDSAASGGYLDIIQWILENRSEGCTASAMNNAASHGHLETIKWLHKNRTEGCTVSAMDNAAYGNHLDVVIWLHENRTEGCTGDALEMALECVNIEVAKWLHENRTERLREFAITRIVDNGALESLKWLCDKDICNIITIDTCNHMEICQWLRDNWYDPVSNTSVNHAMAYHNLAKLQWLYKHHPFVFENHDFDNTGMYGYLSILKWMHYKGIKGCTTKAMDLAAQYNHFDVVQWLHYNRTEGCTSKALESAINVDNLDMFKFLFDNRTKDFSNEALLLAKSKGKVKILNWLQENGHQVN